MASPGTFLRVAASRVLHGLAGFAAGFNPPPQNLTPAPHIEQVPQVSKAAPGFESHYGVQPGANSADYMAKAFESLFGKISTRLGPTNPRWSTFEGEMKPETIVEAQQQCNAGFPYRLCDMYRRAIENDPHLLAVTLQTFAGIVVNPDVINPRPTLARDPLAISVANWLRAVREQVEDFDAARFALLWAEGQGFAAAENVYDYRRIIWYTADGKRISRVYCVPVKLEIVEGRAFQFDTETDQPRLWLDGGYVSLPPAKFIFHEAHGFTQIRERRGFMRSCLPMHAIKGWTVRDMAIYLHLYGIPQMIADYDEKKFNYDQAQALADKVMKSIGQGGIGTVPADLFRLRNDMPPPDGALVHTQAADWLNAQMTKVVTLGPLTMDSAGGSYGLGDVHAVGAYNGQVLRGKNLCTSINRDLWWPTIQLNKYRLAADLNGDVDDVLTVRPQYLPQIDRETDPAKRQAVLSGAMKDGLEVSKTQYRGTLLIDAPKDEEDTLRGVGTPIPSSGAVVSAVEASKGVVAPMPNGASDATSKPVISELHDVEPVENRKAA